MRVINRSSNTVDLLRRSPALISSVTCQGHRHATSPAVGPEGSKFASDRYPIPNYSH